MKSKIIKYLLGCKIRPNLIGFEYLCKAIEIAVNETNISNKITTKIYPEIARIFNVNPISVERAIRWAIKSSIGNFKHMTSGEFMATAIITLKLGSED